MTKIYVTCKSHRAFARLHTILGYTPHRATRQRTEWGVCESIAAYTVPSDLMPRVSRIRGVEVADEQDDWQTDYSYLDGSDLCCCRD